MYITQIKKYQNEKQGQRKIFFGIWAFQKPAWCKASHKGAGSICMECMDTQSWVKELGFQGKKVNRELDKPPLFLFA